MHKHVAAPFVAAMLAGFARRAQAHDEVECHPVDEGCLSMDERCAWPCRACAR